MVFIYGLKSFLVTKEIKESTPIISSSIYKNEKRKFALIESCIGPKQISPLSFSWLGVLNFSLYIKVLGFLLEGKLLRILCKLVRKHDFLVACRASSLIFYYLRIVQMELNPKVAYSLVSSDSNPYALGTSFAFLKKNLKTIYITHGHLPEAPPRNFFDFSFFDGEAMADVYKRMGEIKGKYFLIGAEGSYNPLDLSGLKKENKCIGIFLSLVTDWSSLGLLVGQVSEVFKTDRILVRLHPNEIIRDKKGVKFLETIPNVTISTAETLAIDDIKSCDLIITGNSSVHLTILKYGKPTLYVKGVDAVPHDFYRFVEKGIIPYLEDLSFYRLDDMLQFYSGSWTKKFEYFDSSYPYNSVNKDYSKESIAKAFKEILS